jgi:hypothetical protein
LVCWCGLLLELAGCSRSAVVVAPEGTTRAEELAPPVLAREQSDEADEAIAPLFPDDAGGRLLAKMLPPREPDNIRLPHPGVPRSAGASIRMDPPDLPLPPSQAAMPRLPALARSSPLRPRLVLEESLGGWTETLVLPQQQSLPDAGRVRVPSEDVNQPIPLPVVTQPVPDRASLDDPTADESAAAALAAPLPMRTTPAPFLKLSLPDPYDHRRADVPTPAESREFPLGRPQMPRR